jgi:hypothetical protein
MRTQQLQRSDSNLNPVGRARAFADQNSVNVHVVQRHEFFTTCPHQSTTHLIACSPGLLCRRAPDLFEG